MTRHQASRHVTRHVPEPGPRLLAVALLVVLLLTSLAALGAWLASGGRL